MLKSATLPRMLTQAQAADYCGVSVKAFKDICPVKATPLRDGLLRYDRTRLDHWLDSLSADAPVATDPDAWLQGFKQAISNVQ